MAELSDTELAAGEHAAQSGFAWCLTEAQEEKLRQFRAAIMAKVDEHWEGELTDKEREFLADDVDMLRFLRSRRFDLEAAIDMGWACLQWRRDFQGIGVDNITEDMIQNEIRTGKTFLFRTCKYGRPVGYVKTRLHQTSVRDLKELERFAVFQMEHGRRYLRPWKHIEKNCIVFDLDGFSLGNMDYEFTKFMIHMFQNYYPECMGVTIIINSPWLFWGCWKIISRWIDPVSAKKILFLNTSDLKEYIDEENLPKEYGGTSDWTFEYKTQEERGSEFAYERGWDESEIEKAKEHEEERRRRGLKDGGAAEDAAAASTSAGDQANGEGEKKKKKKKKKKKVDAGGEGDSTLPDASAEDGVAKKKKKKKKTKKEEGAGGEQPTDAVETSDEDDGSAAE
eukprot:TRINITY_DN2668_c0_g4_i1.p1 TRINITY_DN2668_c0_g4~~TRINITY_DN2668_c0_g4_i1.p1  ORF type:complete len:395 (+),score=160.71 TRINITY_DN2668_c0_g4_i1:254-1438(+)